MSKVRMRNKEIMAPVGELRNFMGSAGKKCGRTLPWRNPFWLPCPLARSGPVSPNGAIWKQYYASSAVWYFLPVTRNQRLWGQWPFRIMLWASSSTLEISLVCSWLYFFKFNYLVEKLPSKIQINIAGLHRFGRMLMYMQPGLSLTLMLLDILNVMTSSLKVLTRKFVSWSTSHSSDESKFPSEV